MDDMEPTHTPFNRYVLKGETLWIEFDNPGRGRLERALMDSEMLPEAMKHLWVSDKRGITTETDGRTVELSRFVLKCPDNATVRHLNGERCDFRISNMSLEEGKGKSPRSRGGGLCRVKYCVNPVYGRGMCHDHYSFYIRHRAKKKSVPVDTHFSPNRIEIEDDVASIRLRDASNRTVAKALIDTDDALRVSRYIWSVGVRARINGKRLILSKFIKGHEGPELITHINGNPLDYRSANLRIVSHSELRIRYSKTHRRNTSGQRGVTRGRNRRKWHAFITFEGVRYSGGFHESFEKACVARKELEQRLLRRHRTS